MGVLPLSRGILSQPNDMYSGFLRPDLSVYTMSGFLLISSSTHGGKGILYNTLIQDPSENLFMTESLCLQIANGKTDTKIQIGCSIV